MKTENQQIYKRLLFATLTFLSICIVAGTVYAASGTTEKKGVQLDALHADNDVTCTDCHGEQTQREAVPMIKCLECHDTAELAEKTAEMKPTNPHKNRHYNEEADCNLCHHQHRKSENFCLPCHLRFDFKTP